MESGILSLMEQEEMLLEWEAPDRPVRKRGIKYFRTVGVITFLLVTIALFFRQILLALAIAVWVFVAYVLSAAAPRMITNQLTNKGVESGDKHYPWDKLERYWFGKQEGKTVLYITTSLHFPKQLMLVTKEDVKTKVMNILDKHLARTGPPEPGMFDKISGFLTAKLPLDEN